MDFLILAEKEKGKAINSDGINLARAGPREAERAPARARYAGFAQGILVI
jgi:hypothetical protein